MKLLFIHQNFPGQFRSLAPALAQQGHEVLALCTHQLLPSPWQSVQIVSYETSRISTVGIHPWLTDFETKTIRAEACYRACHKLKAEGFVPEAIIAHPGWGESLFLKEVWPQAKLGIYCEFYYQPEGADTGFDPEFPSTDPEGEVCRLKLKNLNNLLHFQIVDGGIAPTHWQASTFPEPFRSRITVVHDGIDTEAVAPNPAVSLTLNHTLPLTRQDEVITFVNRNLEPYRGYHVFMRALPEILRRRPQARVLLIGGDDVSYGARPSGSKSWKQIFIDEVRPQIPDSDWARVHFLGNLPYNHFLSVLQLSTVHVYLTYPFVLSWSLLEAMCVGCTIVASDTPPLHEAIRHDETGWLIPFFDVPALAESVCSLLENPTTRQRLGDNARSFARQHYNLQNVCLPRQLEWVDSLLSA